MPRTPNRPPHFLFREMLTAFGNGAPSLEDKLRFLADLRAQSPELSPEVDRFLVEDCTNMHSALHTVQGEQEKIKKLHEKLTSPPWHEAVVIQPKVPTPQGPKVLVIHGNARRVVSLMDSLDPDSIRAGDSVFLAENLNVILARSVSPSSGETAAFERRLPDGRLVLRSREEEIVVQAAQPLLEAELRPGDSIRWDRSSFLAFEKLERSQESSFFLEDTPQETFEDIGGLDAQIERLKRSILLHLNYPKIVEKYKLQRVGSVLLVGPPGVGKTLLARALANFMASISGSGRSVFLDVKPGALLSMWYAQSESNVREVFRVARESCARHPGVPTVIFFDEIDSMGAARDHLMFRPDRGVLLALCAELNGLRHRGDVLVVSATNLRSSLDPSLLRPGRLADELVLVPRPDRRAAREIFSKHLGAEIPIALNGNGKDPAAAREEIIEAAASRIFSPNGNGDLATVLFRDGKRRQVKPSDLVNGAIIANVVRIAQERACLREVQTGQTGIEIGDVFQALDQEFESSARNLSRFNCRNILDDMPQDIDVVDVRFPERAARKQHRFLQAL